MKHDIEKLLQSFDIPDAPPENRRAFMAVVRAQTKVNAQVNANRTSARRAGRRLFVAASAAAVVILGIMLWPRAHEPRREGTTQKTSPTEPAVAAVGTIESEVLTIQRDGQTLELKKGDALRLEDELHPARRSDVRLRDGSFVRIDGGSELILRRPAAGERARLRLSAGRIFLRVSEASGTFAVLAGARVSVVGTAFAVAEHEGVTEVNVIDGKVKLESGGKEIELERGQSGAAAEGAAPETTSTDPNTALLWARDTVRFDDRPIGEVLDWISQNSSYRFNAPPAMRQLHVSVAISDEPLMDIIDAVVLTHGLTRRVEGNDIMISK